MALWIDQKYALLASSRLELFKQKKTNLFNFRCPFCGDSKTNKLKARGFLYEYKQALVFKCHNCHQSKSLFAVLEQVDPALAKEYSRENFTSRNERVVEVKEPEAPTLIPTGITEELLFTTGAQRLTDSLGLWYAKERKLPEKYWNKLYYIEHMKDLERIAPAYEGRLKLERRLLIPFHNDQRRIVGLSGRALDDNKLRYQTVKLFDEPLVYGLNYIDKFQRVYITEGPFDSMFLDNAIGAGGSSMLVAASMFDDPVIVFDNQPRNPEIVSQIRSIANKGFAMVVWPQSWNYKDINEAISDGISQEAVQKVIYNCTFKDLSLQLALKEWVRL